MSLRLRFLVLALALFGAEVLVATLLSHVGFIRGSVSDLLVVPLMYCAIQAVRPMKPAPLAAGLFVFACAVEAAQYVHLADRLHFAKGSLPYVLLGNSFSFMDILMYGVGSVAVYAVDRHWLRRKARRAHGA